MQFLVFVAAVLLSAVFTRLVRDYANRHGWATPPASDRHIHTRPIPRLGGVAIFLTLWCIALLAHWASDVAAGLAVGAVTERLLRHLTGYGIRSKTDGAKTSELLRNSVCHWRTPDPDLHSHRGASGGSA